MADNPPHDSPKVHFCLDESNLMHGEWTTGLCECRPTSSYDWFACCCPCVVITQLRLHLSALDGERERDLMTDTSYGCQVTLQFFKFVTPICWGFSSVVCAFHRLNVINVIGLVCMAFLVCASYKELVENVATTRKQLRERLQIPPSSCSDTAVSLIPVGGVIIQMGRQFRCDKRPYFRSPAELPAYPRI